jgi:DNA-binding protein H-NS
LPEAKSDAKFSCMSAADSAQMRIRNLEVRVKNPEAMTFDELLAFRERLMAMIASKTTAVRKQLQAQMARLDGLTGGKSIRGSSRGQPHALKGRKIAPKYRGPKGETWAGRGIMPLWMREQIKRGRKPEHFAIGKKGVVKRGRRKKA